MTNEHARKPPPKKKHHLREADELAESVIRDGWADPIGGFVGERVFYDPRLQRQQIPPNTGVEHGKG